MKNKFGFLREKNTSGIDKTTKINRTGLDEYLRAIFPDINDWEHDKTVPNSIKKYRPDYRSESLKLIVEFDGMPHYQNPDVIRIDLKKNEYYKNMGYKVVRIPYFIQLTNGVIKQMFGVDVKEEMFPEGIPSLSIENRNTPAFLCCSGVERMKKEFEKYPEQYATNIEFLKSQNDEFLTGINLL